MVEEEDPTAVTGENGEIPTQEEDTVQQQPSKTPERIHVDTLQDISEENVLKELEPYEYHCYTGWEDAVCGWARVAPLSCILLTQKKYKKPKHKEADNPTPLSADPTASNADSSTNTVEQHCESQVGMNNLKKFMPLNQQKGSWSPAAAAAQQPDIANLPVFSAMNRSMAHLMIEGKTEEEATLTETTLQPRHVKYSTSQTSPPEPQNYSRRTGNTVVPIKTFTFLPPIKPPQLNPGMSGYLHRCKKPTEGGSSEENCYMLAKKTGMRGRGVDIVAKSDLPRYPAGLSSKYQTSQHNPNFFSMVSVSVPKRHQVLMPPQSGKVHHSSYSIGKSISQTTAQPHMHPGCLFS